MLFEVVIIRLKLDYQQRKFTKIFNKDCKYMAIKNFSYCHGN